MNYSGLLVGGVFVAGLVVLGWQSLQNSPVTQSRGMVPEDTSGIEAGAPIASVRIPAAFSTDAQIGKRVFEAKCAVCHGTNAAGQNGVAPPLVNDIYRPGHHGDGAFVYAARNGVQSHHWNFGNMPPIEGLTDADVRYVARYVRELQRENGIN